MNYTSPTCKCCRMPLKTAELASLLCCECKHSYNQSKAPASSVKAMRKESLKPLVHQ